MGKAKSNRSPLAKLRNGIGKTQAQFAELIGESVSYVEKLEQGTKPVTDELAILLMLLFGCHPHSLKKKRGSLQHLVKDTGPLLELIRIWEKFLPITSADAAEMFRECIVPKLTVLLRAAGSQQRALILLCRLDEWIARELGRLNLQQALDTELAACEARGAPVDWRPLIGTSIAHNIEITLPLFEETGAALGKRATTAAPEEGEAMLQVNPDKMRRAKAKTRSPLGHR
jgi:transcriptional regulator with XRE-family HTH domain